MANERQNLLDALESSPLLRENDMLARLATLACNADTALEAILKDVPETTEHPRVDDYITGFAERQQIFQQWRTLQKDYHLSPFTPAAVGIMMIAPLEILRDPTRALQEIPLADNLGKFDVLCSHSTGAIRTYLPGGSSKAKTAYSVRASDPSTPMQQDSVASDGVASASTPGQNQPNSTSERDRNAALQCKARDGQVCILSGTTDPVAAHIFPHASCGDEKTTLRYSVLRMFWGQEKADLWRAKFIDSDFVESHQNMIAMNHQLHFWFDRARFAFKPLPSENPNERRLQFHWLKRSGFRTFNSTLQNGDFIARAGLDAANVTTWGDELLAHRKSGLPIKTGQVFTVHAQNADDLPDWDMLQLQWDLHRVAAIAGAGEDEDDVDWEFENEGGPDVDFSRIEQWLLDHDDPLNEK
ncbi:hypothetical protein ACHAPT_003664 [Fusarium lateritium]